jgi:hypothetical protein
MMAAAPLVRVTPDHLELVRSLIVAGQTGRALELLDAVWHPRLAEEQCWYLRLWLLTAAGRMAEALDLARTASHELPGSAAVAYLHAALEHAFDSPAAALEAAKRAAIIAPDQPVTAMMVRLLSAPSDGVEEPAMDPLTDRARMTGLAEGLPTEVNLPPNPVAAAQVGAALLFPLGSGRPLLPARAPVASSPAPVELPAYDRRRFGVIAVATAVCALWAIYDPVPAALVLGATVVLAARGWRN